MSFHLGCLGEPNSVLDLALATDETSTAGGNQTDLLSRNTRAGNRGWVTNMLMVTTTVGMLNRVHSNTTNNGPGLSLGLVLVVGASSLQQRLLGTSTSSDGSDHGTACGLEDLTHTRWQTDTGEALVGVVGNNHGVVAGGAGESGSVTGVLLDVAHGGTFGDLTDGEHVADGELGLGTEVQELSGVHSLSGDDQFLVGLVLVRITEVDDSKGCTSTGVVDDVLDDTLDVSVTLGEIELAELGCSLTLAGVGPEDASTTPSLSANDSAHC